MVTEEEGIAFAQESGCLFVESSAKTRENVEKCVEELALKVYLHKPERYLIISKVYLFALDTIKDLPSKSSRKLDYKIMNKSKLKLIISNVSRPWSCFE